jgi:hypothetical protein
VRNWRDEDYGQLWSRRLWGEQGDSEIELGLASLSWADVDLHSNLRLGSIWVKSGTEIETGASFSLNLSANFVALSGESGSFSIAGFQVSMTVSEMHSAPVSTALMASSLRTPKTRAVIPSAIRTR